MWRAKIVATTSQGKNKSFIKIDFCYSIIKTPFEKYMPFKYYIHFVKMSDIQPCTENSTMENK